MSPITNNWATVQLTASQIDAWPEMERACGLTDAWYAAPRIALFLPRLERSVPVCRRVARSWLDTQRIDDDEAHHLLLLVLSELLTNAIRHSASDTITCRLWQSESELFAEIRDQGGTPSVPRMRQTGMGKEHGRGLALVAETACAWGFRVEANHACTVWAAVPLTPNRSYEHPASDRPIPQQGVPARVAQAEHGIAPPLGPPPEPLPARPVTVALPRWNARR